MPATTDIAEAGGPARPKAQWLMVLSPLKPSLPYLAAACLLTGVLCLVFWRVTLEQQVLSPGDLVFQSYPWLDQQPSGYEGPSNPWQSDDAYLYYPRRHSLFEDSGGGHWWQDDYLTSARNTFSNDFLGLEYYPPGVLYRVLPYAAANSGFHLSILLVAGFGMFALLRQLRFPATAAAYGGMLFMLNGHFMVWLGAWSLPAMLGLLPLMIFGFEKWHETRGPPWLLIPALCIALQVMIAYIPALVMTAVILSLYGASRLAPLVLAKAHTRIALHAGAYIGAGTAGLALGAYSLFPSLASAFSSSYQQDRALGLGHVPLENAWMFMFPDFFGSPRNWFGFGGNYPEWIAYVGISSVPLVLPGVWHLRKHWLGWFAVALIAFSASQVYGIPPLKELAHITGLRQVAATRWYFGMNLGAALLAPAGLAAMIDTSIDARDRRRLAIAVAAICVTALTAIAILYFDRRDSSNWIWITEGRHLIPRPWDVVSEITSGSTEFHRQVAALLAGCTLIAAALVFPSRARFIIVAVFLVTFLDLFTFAQHYNGTVARDELYPETPGLEYLESDEALFRIAPIWSDGGTMVLPGYTANLYGLSTITGYDHYRDPSYLAFLAPIRSKNDIAVSDLYGYVTVGTNRQPLNQNILRLLNVKYVVTPPDGLFSSTAGQTLNEAAFPIYSDHSQGQVINPPAGTTSIEFLLATGGGRAPDAPLKISISASPKSTSPIREMTLDSRDVEDNHWYRIELPADHSEALYFQIESTAPQDHPYFAWGATSTAESGDQRFENGVAAAGSLTYRALTSHGDWLTTVYQGDDLSIYQLIDPLPRAWGVGSIELLDHEAAISRVAANDFQPTSEAVLEISPGDAGDSSNNVEVGIQHYSPGDIRLHTDGGGWIVFSERYDGGWKATVDGNSAEVLRADGILMAVQVTPGEHDVHMSFDPPEYVWGRRISIATAILVVLVLALYSGYRFRLRQRSAQIDSDSTYSRT